MQREQLHRARIENAAKCCAAFGYRAAFRHGDGNDGGVCDCDWICGDTHGDKPSELYIRTVRHDGWRIDGRRRGHRCGYRRPFGACDGGAAGDVFAGEAQEAGVRVRDMAVPAQ